MMKIITCAGISEAFPPRRTMLTSLIERIPDVHWVDLPYKRSYGPVGAGLFGQSFNQTLAQAHRLLEAELEWGPAIVVGYSAGAAAAGHFAARGHRNLIGVGLVADPFQPKHVTGDGLYGVAGTREINGVPVRWVFNPKDMICQAPDDSPIRRFSALTADFSLRDLKGYLSSMALRAASPIRNDGQGLRRALRAINDLRGYLAEGQHTLAYDVWRDRDGRVLLDDLADWIKVMA